MSKFYNIEIKFTKDRWTLLSTHTKQVDAMHEIKSRIKDKYPLRIVRVRRDTVFEVK